ncbi:MAG: hybrid sensor histidine kinase/response regulator [Rhodospirillaceae bacterium]|nr:hybrid sensor histidine kinase/response regulator [Rhodospirillaceae bacterium]MBT5812715.1 hybrid sensor histidine kinase/response regulator [Rhodospirillaceae bacterium]
MSDEIEFASPDDMGGPKGEPWKILIVDDEPSVHSMTRIVLSDFEFEGRGLEFVSAHSAMEAKKVLVDNSDAAMVLLDVVMETDHAGLDVARYIRNEAQNDQIRIVLRTGQPGQAPETTVIRDYDINDYKEKTELTSARLTTTVYASLRAFRDIVELKKQGVELRQATQAAEVAERAKATFMGTASHELRTPLNAILGFSQLMKDEVFGPLGNEKYVEYAEDIESSGANLLSLVEDLLDMADGTVRAAPLREETFNLAELVEECLSGLNIEGTFEVVATDLNGSVMPLQADRLAVRRMILCLLSNAVKYATAPKNIDVSAQRLEDGRLMLSVRDDGPGLNENDIERLERPFSEKAAANIADGGGIGLGLSIARELIQRHDGKLTLANATSGGAVAGLVFPSKRAPVAN